MAAEFPDEEWLQPVEDPENDFEPQIWHWTYFRAFDALQHDRFFGAMGGEGPIFYMALSQYARDHGISGAALQWFHIFMNALDAEFLELRRAEVKPQDAPPQEN